MCRNKDDSRNENVLKMKWAAIVINVLSLFVGAISVLWIRMLSPVLLQFDVTDVWYIAHKFWSKIIRDALYIAATGSNESHLLRFGDNNNGPDWGYVYIAHIFVTHKTYTFISSKIQCFLLWFCSCESDLFVLWAWMYTFDLSVVRLAVNTMETYGK